MADFTFLDINPTMESLNQFTELKSLNYQSFSPFSSDNLFNNNQAPEAEIPSNWENNLPAAAGINHYSNNGILYHGNEVFHENQKRKSWDFVSESNCGNPTSPYVSESGFKIRNNPGKGKKAKSNDKEEDKPREVVHVRARRGQATNSHCLAERVRREKINERLRSLQDIVPGCYKNMGMAVMLDEIINYVQFLQNQIEFLSMKLTAASSCYDFNSDSDNMETMQRKQRG